MKIEGTRFHREHFELMCRQLQNGNGYATLILLKQDYPVVWGKLRPFLNEGQYWRPGIVAKVMDAWLKSLDLPESTQSKTGGSRSPSPYLPRQSPERDMSGCDDQYLACFEGKKSS